MKKIIIAFFAIILTHAPVFSENLTYMNMPFWEKFNDENLINNLVTIYQNNNDLKAAVLKVNEANRVVKMSFADELPYIGFKGYAGRIFNSSDEKFGDITIPDYTESHFLFPLTMNYEIDIWGKNHLKTKSKKMQLEMIKQDEKSAYIYISSAFAIDYYNLIRADKLVEYYNNLINLQKDIINSYQCRYEYGTATLSDIEKARKDLTFYQEELQKLEERREVLLNQISVLLSNRSFDKIKRSDFNDINPSLKIPENVDFAILEQRPDSVKSELELKRIGIDIKTARRDLLPKFIITGNLGFNWYNISSSHKFLSDIGIVPVWDIFTGGRKLQLLKLQKDKYDIALQHYEKTILKVIQESNDALYSTKTAKKIKNTAKERLNSDTKEYSYTITKADAGIADKLDILRQEKLLTISQIESVSAEVNEIISAINLYQALGGIDYTALDTTLSGENI